MTIARGPRLVTVPITLRDANEFIRQHHRHHDPARGCRFVVAVAVAGEEQVRGVAVVSRPVARHLQDGWTAEVTRLATDGTRNACSFLYAAAWRAARAIGFRRLVTYTLPEEGGGLPARRRVAPDRRGRRRQLAPRPATTGGPPPPAGEDALGGLRRGAPMTTTTRAGVGHAPGGCA